MGNFSLTLAGVVVSVAGTLLVKFGFDEACSSQIIQLAPVLIGGAISYIGRIRAGGLSLAGFKK